MKNLILFKSIALCLLFQCSLLDPCVYAQHANTANLEIPEVDDGLPGFGTIRRYDWFKNLWKQKRSGWAKDVEKDQQALVFLGDSITQGWGNKLGGNFSGAKVANRGISGDTTRGMLIRLKGDVLDLHPRGVVMLMGTNDLEEKGEPETIVKNVMLIIGELKKADPAMPIVWCNVFPSHASKSRPAEKIKLLNKLVGEAVKGDPTVRVLDTWTLFANAEGDAQKVEFPDLLHPNKLGYAKWASALRPVLATLGFVETEAAPFTPDEGYVSLFNGKDLTGWATRAKKTLEIGQVYDGKAVTDDGRYAAINGRLVVTLPPEGRRIQQFWTSQEFEKDFTLKLEFRATPNADSGIFIRGKQLQCRDYPLAGPYKELKAYKPQDWNEVVIKVTGTTAHCTCNGEVLEAAFMIPAKGPIGLEGDHGQMEYRRIQIKAE
ncbi:MAG: lysophospholipase L1-like esterase [Kiritimatiellia bacterium]|jgi:lysophospholipase L1-like esterase